MNVGVVVFPGSNCDEDAISAFRDILGQNVIRLWHKDSSFNNIDLIVLPGGFSYGDYLRSGAIAKFSPIMQAVINFAKEGGFVLGICNGFQILCEAGLLPGTLIRNCHHNFVCKNTFIKSQNNNSIFSDLRIQKNIFKIPIAHAEGCYFADSKTLQEITENKQIVFKYCNEEGEVNNLSNPNGSLKNIAGICNGNKNIFGMMPHPERACDSNLGNTDGKLILEAAITRIENMGR